MKRLFALVLTISMLLGLVACGSAAPSKSGAEQGGKEGQKATFMAGYGKVDITPQETGVPMNGYASSSERLSTGLLSYLYSIAVAVQDAEGNMAIVVSVDIAALSESYTSEIRDWTTKMYGVPKENILIAAIHQHSCPDPSNADFTTSQNFRILMLKGIKNSITMAIEDLAPAEVQLNKVTTEALSFVRHYWTNDGTLCGDGFGDFSSGLVGHESESDKEMRLVKFAREEKEDIILVNFQGHPHLGTKEADTDIHSDWPGVMRDEVTAQLGANCIYFSGAGGNMNSSSRIVEENISVDFRDHGKRAAKYVVDAEGSYTKVEAGTIACKEVVLTYDTDHSMDHLVTEARIIAEARSRDSQEARALLKQYPQFNSIYHASAVVNKAAAGPTRDITIGVITFGEVAITAHPYEMFDTNGMELRAGSVGNENYDGDDQLENPYTMTIISTLANSSDGYIPSRLGYTNGGYSTDITKFAPGTGEQLVGDYLRLLNELHD